MEAVSVLSEYEEEVPDFKLLKQDLGVIAAKKWHTDTPLWDVQMHWTIDTSTAKGKVLQKFFESFGAVFQS